MPKEIPVFKPGSIGNFFYYFSEILNTIFMTVFTVAMCFITVIYFWSMISAQTVPFLVFGKTEDIWTPGYHIQNIACLPFFALFIFILKKNLTDLFTKKKILVLKIDKKGINYTGHTVGSKDYYIGGNNEYFSVTKKAFDKLNEGDTVQIRYTGEQKNVRGITVLR
jgi:hypothetical protein